MRWYEYKMEVDDLHASDDLKAKLLAMQPAEEAPKPARKPKKAIHFPRKTLSIAACGLLCGVGLYAAVHSPFSTLPSSIWSGAGRFSSSSVSFWRAALSLTLTMRDVEEIDACPAALGHRLACDKAGKRWLHHPRAETYLSERVALFQRLYR